MSPNKSLYNLFINYKMANKSTWWSVTAFGDEIPLLENSEFPEFVAKVHGGREECPETKREHFQGAVQCRRQVRLAQLKGWLPRAHFEPARDRLALKKYVMKAETAVGEKTTQENTVQHVSMESLMIKMANYWDEEEYIQIWNKEENHKLAFKYCYWRMVNLILEECPEYRKVCQLFARSDTVSLWENTRSTWLKVAEGYSITPPQEGHAENIIVRLDINGEADAEQEVRQASPGASQVSARTERSGSECQ